MARDVHNSIRFATNFFFLEKRYFSSTYCREYYFLLVPRKTICVIVCAMFSNLLLTYNNGNSRTWKGKLFNPHFFLDDTKAWIFQSNFLH